MKHYGSLRRRELRAMPTYQYPQQMFVAVSPDVLVQQGTTYEDPSLAKYDYGDGSNYGFLELVNWGIGTYQQSKSQEQADALAAATTKGQMLANTSVAINQATADAAFQKRLPFYLLTGTVFSVIAILFIGELVRDEDE